MKLSFNTRSHEFPDQIDVSIFHRNINWRIFSVASIFVHPLVEIVPVGNQFLDFREIAFPASLDHDFINISTQSCIIINVLDQGLHNIIVLVFFCQVQGTLIHSGIFGNEEFDHFEISIPACPLQRCIIIRINNIDISRFCEYLDNVQVTIIDCDENRWRIEILLVVVGPMDRSTETFWILLKQI